MTRKERKQEKRLQKLRMRVIKVQMSKLDQKREEKAEEKAEKKRQDLSEQIAFYEKKTQELNLEEGKVRKQPEIVTSSGDEFIR